MVLVVIVGGIVIAGRKNEPLASLTPTPTPTATVVVVASESPSPSASATPTPAPASATITYTDSGYTPAMVTIRKGGTITYKNASSKEMWPASAKHPTHDVYSESGGCIGSLFDACARIPVGSTWSFTFNKVGEWGFHDHITPNFFGKITVQ